MRRAVIVPGTTIGSRETPIPHPHPPVIRALAISSRTNVEADEASKQTRPLY